jgi:hypothetical protein
VYTFIPNQTEKYAKQYECTKLREHHHWNFALRNEHTNITLDTVSVHHFV